MKYRPRFEDDLVPLIRELKCYNRELQRRALEMALNSLKSGNDISYKEQDQTAEIESPVSTRITTLEELIECCKIDLDNWLVDRYVINKWEVGSTIDDVIVVEPLFQVKAWLKRNTDRKILENVKIEMMNAMKRHSHFYPKRTYQQTTSPHLLEISIFDLHFGKLCWGKETGDNYDTKIAEKRFLKAIDDLIEKSKGFDIERILFPVGNDFFNADKSFPYNATTKGTPQEEDLRWQKTFKKGRELLIKAIDKLHHIAPVDVLIVQGNHDFERAFYVGDALECWYNNAPDISVDNNPNPRKYKRYGNNLIGFTHGNNEKLQNLPLIVAHENPKDWADTKYREMHLGHLHHKKDIKFISTQEFNGMTIRHLRSLSGTDAWHNLKGFKGSIQSAEAFLWCKKKGLVGQFTHSL